MNTKVSSNSGFSPGFTLVLCLCFFVGRSKSLTWVLLAPPLSFVGISWAWCIVTSIRPRCGLYANVTSILPHFDIKEASCWRSLTSNKCSWKKRIYDYNRPELSLRPNKKKPVYRVTRSCLKLVKPRIFSGFPKKNIILSIFKGDLPFRLSKWMKSYFFPEKKNEKKICVLTLPKIFRPLTQNDLFFLFGPTADLQS